MKIKKIGLLVFSLVAVLILATGCGNKPPNVPEIITGAGWTKDSTYTRATATVFVATTDPNKNRIYYIMDWGDGVIDTQPTAEQIDQGAEPFPSGETVAVYHSYAKWTPPRDPLSKNFEIKASAKDDKGKIQASYSNPLTMRVIYNDEPDRPEIFKKNDKGAIDTKQTFKARAEDPEEDSVAIRFSFQKSTEWSPLRPSGDTIYGYNAWSNDGTVKVWAFAKDSKGSQSISSETLLFEVIGEGYVKETFQAVFVEEGEPETLGFQSSPALANIAGVDKIFIGSEASYAYIINTPDMTKDASVDHYKEYPDDFYEWGNTPAVDIANSRWYLANDQGEFYGLGITGSKLWRYPGFNTNFTGWSFTDAAFSGSYVYVATEDTLYALNASTGLAAWRQHAPGASITTSPIVDATGNVLIGDDSGYVRKFNGSTGAEIWKKDIGGWIPTSGAIGSDGTIYFCVNGDPDKLLCALNPDSGSVNWSYSVGIEVTTSIVIDAQGALYFGDDDGRIHGVIGGSSKTGFPIPLYAGGLNATVSTPSFAADNFFYVMTDEQHVFCIKNDPVNPKVEWETPLPTSDIAEMKKHGTKREDDLVPSPVIGTDGDIYVSCGADYIGLYQLKGHGTTGGPMPSAWPTFRHDRQRTGKAGPGTR